MSSFSYYSNGNRVSVSDHLKRSLEALIAVAGEVGSQVGGVNRRIEQNEYNFQSTDKKMTDEESEILYLMNADLWKMQGELMVIRNKMKRISDPSPPSYNQRS